MLSIVGSALFWEYDRMAWLRIFREHVWCILRRCMVKCIMDRTNGFTWFNFCWSNYTKDAHIFGFKNGRFSADHFFLMDVRLFYEYYIGNEDLVDSEPYNYFHSTLLALCSHRFAQIHYKRFSVLLTRMFTNYFYGIVYEKHIRGWILTLFGRIVE